MSNKVNLTDDELSLVQTSLKMSIMGYEKYIKTYGDKVLDSETKNAIKEMTKLHDRLNKEYF